MWDYRGEQLTKAPIGMIVEAILAGIGPMGAARSEERTFVDVPENLKRFFASTRTAQDTSSCCSADEQESCCELQAPAQKASCCGDSASSSRRCR